MYLVSVNGKRYRRHIYQIKRSCSVARDLGENITVKIPVDEGNIKPNENEITMIDRYPQRNRRPQMRFSQGEWI